MVFFNDPVPISDPAERAVKMVMTMREAAGTLISAWRERGRQLGFGVGTGQDYATLARSAFPSAMLQWPGSSRSHPKSPRLSALRARIDRDF